MNSVVEPFFDGHSTFVPAFNESCDWPLDILNSLNSDEEWLSDEENVIIDMTKSDYNNASRLPLHYALSSFDSTTPLLKLGQSVFQLVPRKLIGQAMIFEKTESELEDTLKIKATTSRYLSALPLKVFEKSQHPQTANLPFGTSLAKAKIKAPARKRRSTRKTGEAPVASQVSVPEPEPEPDVSHPDMEVDVNDYDDQVGFDQLGD